MAALVERRLEGTSSSDGVETRAFAGPGNVQTQLSLDNTEDRGKAVHVEEGGHLSVQLNVIPAVETVP
jgi:hypothetical protein